MRGALDQPPIVIGINRIRTLWLVLSCAVFVAVGGLLMLARGEAAIVGMVTVAIFALWGALGLAMLVGPMWLEISPMGITQKVLWRTTTLAWADVYHFRPVVLGSKSRMVGFEYVNEPPPGRARSAKMSMAAAGVHGRLRAGWEIGPGKLADLLNEGRRHWLVGAEPAHAPLMIAPAQRLQSSHWGVLSGGRLNRKGYWIAASTIFALAVALSFVPGGRTAISGMNTALFIRVFGGRLHDLGKSAWWQLLIWGVVIGTVILFVLAKAPVTMGIGAAFLIQLLCMAALGVIPGTPEANRYGPAPGRPSLMEVAETFR